MSPVDPILKGALDACGVPGASRAYEADRDKAIAWYRQQGFPSHHHESSVGQKVLETLSRTAADRGIWREAWAGFHWMLAGLVTEREAQDVAGACLQLGRAHVAMHSYELATLYLRCTQVLANRHSQPDFTAAILAEQAVCALLSGSFREYQEIIADLVTDASKAENVAEITFKEGRKNARWADAQGRRSVEDLKLAGAQLGVSLDLNKRLLVPQAVGVILCEMGDVHKHSGNRERARELYEDSLEILTSLGQGSMCADIRERLRNL